MKLRSLFLVHHFLLPYGMRSFGSPPFFFVLSSITLLTLFFFFPPRLLTPPCGMSPDGGLIHPCFELMAPFFVPCSFRLCSDLGFIMARYSLCSSPADFPPFIVFRQFPPPAAVVYLAIPVYCSFRTLIFMVLFHDCALLSPTRPRLSCATGEDRVVPSLTTPLGWLYSSTL